MFHFNKNKILQITLNQTFYILLFPYVSSCLICPYMSHPSVHCPAVPSYLNCPTCPICPCVTHLSLNVPYVLRCPIFTWMSYLSYVLSVLTYSICLYMSLNVPSVSIYHFSPLHVLSVLICLNCPCMPCLSLNVPFVPTCPAVIMCPGLVPLSSRFSEIFLS